MSPPSGNQRKHDPHEIEGVEQHSKVAAFPWLRVSFFIFVCGMIVIAQGPLPGKIWRAIVNTKKEQPAQLPVKPVAKPVDITSGPISKPIPEPTKKTKPVTDVKVIAPVDHTASSGGDLRRMSKGFDFKTMVTLVEGEAASFERDNKVSYVAEYELKVRMPTATTTMEDLQRVSPGIELALPGLKEMMPLAQISPFYFSLYKNKTERLKKNATQINDLMTRHNFFDCETILNLKHPRSGRRVLLMQADMDVVSDGSDGDRLPVMPDTIVGSSNYQPMTSYGWKKTGSTPNPLISGWKSRIAKAKAEIAEPVTKPERKAWLQLRIKKIRREIEDMQARSYLIAAYDPFIVMPINMVTDRSDKYAASIGDYAVVFHKGKIYPCIVGDAGPSFKVGEASLRMAKQLNPRAGPYSRPVSNLAVTYLVFPGTAGKFKAPDYLAWHQKCASLLGEMGGVGAQSNLHRWVNTLPAIGDK